MLKAWVDEGWFLGQSKRIWVPSPPSLSFTWLWVGIFNTMLAIMTIV